MARQPRDLRQLLDQHERLVAGLISGTSADGIDCVIVRLRGSGLSLAAEILSFVSVPYPPSLREAVLTNSDDNTASIRALSQLNFRLASEFAAAIATACDSASVRVEDLDLVGSHGQTVHHVPDTEVIAGIETRSTLQIGDPSVLANHLGVPVVGDFRVADMAFGGQGAPLVPYGDYVLFRHPSTHRILLNLGGIANITVLEAGCAPEDVIAFDTGPANMLIDAILQDRFGRAFDDGGEIASSGSACEPLLDELLKDEYYSRQPPKSTGRERFGAEYVNMLMQRADNEGCSDVDVVATVSELTARTVANAIRDFTGLAENIFQLVVGGGGAHNHFIMRRLDDLLQHAEVITTGELGVSPDAREAVCFAVMAHETLNGQPTAMAAVTGASRAAILGKICVPTTE